jgi:endo-1,4-beta-xylanase
MLTKRAALCQMAAALAVAANKPAFAQLHTNVAEGGASLRTLAVRRHLIFGCAANTFQLKDVDFAAILPREAGILVAEYEMKRRFIENVRGQYDFAAGDALFKFATAHSMGFRGHTLVWHRNNPSWLEGAVTDSHDIKLLTSYIEAVAGHYKGKLHSWDVVNEAISPGDGRVDGLRNSFWLKAFGPSYIDLAFRAARATDPNALLVYNDQGCEAGGPENDHFRVTVLNFLEKALVRRVPIDALGLQGHLRAYGTPVDQKKLRAFLDDVKSLGLRILITEHDVGDDGGPSDAAARARAVADTSRRFLDVVLANSATIGVLTWGLSDRYLADGFFGSKPRALPLDVELRRKPMWQAIAGAFAGK